MYTHVRTYVYTLYYNTLLYIILQYFTYIRGYIDTYIYTYVHTTYTYIHTYIHTYIVRMDREISRGCLQGSCCSPGLWNIQYNSLMNLTFKRRTKAVAFADNLILDIRGKSIRVVENFSNAELSKITAWSKKNKIRFNEEKSKVMLISRRKRKESKEIKVHLQNKPLEQVTMMNYLGRIIVSKFKFSEHISYAAIRCVKLIHSLSKSAKISWGLQHEVLQTIYKEVILPHLLYGAPVWIEAMQYEHNRQKYIRVQRLMNIRMAKMYRTTSSEASCILTGMTP